MRFYVVGPSQLEPVEERMDRLNRSLKKRLVSDSDEVVGGKARLPLQECLIQFVPLMSAHLLDGSVCVLLPSGWQDVNPRLPRIPINGELIGHAEPLEAIRIRPRVNERADIIRSIPGEPHDD
jgi:hypothetical protein